MNMHADIAERTKVNMTSKGQVLIPKAIRDRTGLVPGEQVEVGINDRGEAVIQPGRREATTEERIARMRAAIAKVAGSADFGCASTDEYMALIRPYAQE